MCDQQMLRSACAYAQSDQSLCSSLEYSMTVKLLTEHLLEVLSLKGGCTGSSESTFVKVPHCWKSHATAHLSYVPLQTVWILIRPDIGPDLDPNCLTRKELFEKADFVDNQQRAKTCQISAYLKNRNKYIILFMPK